MPRLTVDDLLQWMDCVESIASDMVDGDLWGEYAHSREMTEELARQSLSIVVGIASIGHLDHHWDGPLAPTAPIPLAQKKLLNTPPRVAAPLWRHVQRAFKQDQLQAFVRRLDFPQVRDALVPTREQLWETRSCHNPPLVCAARCVNPITGEPPLRFRSYIQPVIELARDRYPDILDSSEYLVERKVPGPRLVLLSGDDTIEELPSRDIDVSPSRDKFSWDRSKPWV